MDEQRHFDIAYRLAAMMHRLVSLERRFEDHKALQRRVGLFIVLVSLAILSNLSSGQISSVLGTLAKALSIML